jgi:hypothetical protein
MAGGKPRMVGFPRAWLIEIRHSLVSHDARNSKKIRMFENFLSESGGKIRL